MPLISVIVPCYNQAQYLDECLQSVLNQSYQDWECIIVNDGSPDNIEKVAKQWVEKDSRFRYLCQENKGVSAARNLGIHHAKGEWILPLDGDDYISNDYLELASLHFCNNEIKVICCNARKFGIVDEPFVLKDFSLENLASGNMIFCSAFFKKENWKNVNGYDENFTESYEDWEFWISILKNGGKVYKLNELCFFYRIKENSRNANVTKKRIPNLFYLERKHIEFFQLYLGSMIRNHNDLIAQRNLNKRFLNKFVNKIYSYINK